MRRWPSYFCLLGVAAAGCKPVCTHCPSVAGRYADTSPMATNTCDGDGITWGGGAKIPVQLTQKGSQLTLVYGDQDAGAEAVEGPPITLTGTLYNDNSAEFGPEDQTLVDMTSGIPITDGATLDLKGAFKPGQSPLFAGTWALELVNDYGCTAKSATTWTPLADGG